jgi:hypothetical protein
MKGDAMFCQCCGIEAPTKKTAFYQNIGVLVMRFSQSIEGNLCKNCIHKNFWKMTLTTLFLGWWGMISLIVTPFLLLNNVIRYLLALPMPPVPDDACVPSLTNKDREKIIPHLDSLIQRLNEDGSAFQEVVDEFADRINLTPGQIAMAIRELAEAAEQQE